MKIIISIFLFFSIASSHQNLQQFVLSAEDSAYLNSLKNKDIIIAYSHDLAQVKFNGKSYGTLDPVLDILRDELGLKISVKKANWHDAFSLIDSNKVDFYGPIAIIDSRRQEYIVVEPFYRSHSKIITRKENPVRSMMGLYNRPVGLLENSAMSKAMSTYLGPKNQIIYFPNLEAMINGLRTKVIDAFGTIDDADYEIFAYPDIQFEFPVENFYVDQGFISANENMRKLAEILSRYFKMNPQVYDKIIDKRKQALLEYSRERLSKEIEFLKENYKEILICPSLAFYPLCYVEGGNVKGMFTEIVKVFEELTGMDIDFYNYEKYNDVKTSVVGELKNNKCFALVSTYYDIDINADPELEYSPIMWQETMHAYSYRKNMIDENLFGKSIGVTPFSSNYIGWNALTGKQPIQYSTYGKAMDALKHLEIDAVFIGEMQFDYGYSILKDYSLYEVTGLSAEASMSMLYLAKNQEFNKIFNETMALFQALNPTAAEKWKAESNKYKSDYISIRNAQQVWMIIAIVGMSVILVLLIYLLIRTLRSFFAVRKTNDDLLDKVNCDMLTGIYNRRFLENNLKRIIKSLSRSGGKLSLLFIDVDFFKKYNDTYGHSKGDDCLKAVAKTLADSLLRADDFVARYGGEEFVVVLPNTDEKGISQVANNFLENVRLCKIPHEKNEASEFVTISIGGTTNMVEYTQNGQDYIKKADIALYKSKQNGRNRYTFEPF